MPRAARSTTTGWAALRVAARLVPAAAWMGVIFALSARSDLPDVGGLPAAVTSVAGHVGAYAILAVLVWWGLAGAAVAGRARVVLAWALALAYGVTDEWHQSFVPGRHPDPADLLADGVGAAAGLAVVVASARARARRRGGDPARG